jgi:NAD(P)-dependent dehydrogenase (short-subunit alcohol dehydrogenase family)
VKSAALELGAHKITVNAVIPGLVNTPLTRHADRYAQAIVDAGGTPSGGPVQDERTAIEILKKKTLLGVSWIETEDHAPLVVYLATDQARNGERYRIRRHRR